MAVRPVFLPHTSKVGVIEKMLEFQWHPGLAKSQKQKSIRELHAAAALFGHYPILEISSKSENNMGIELSAFNLKITTRLKGFVFTVETAFQGSKVFEKGGPYKDLLGLDSLSAKKDIRLKESGNLVGFDFFGNKFPIYPRTYFYDWIYINALRQNNSVANKILHFEGFSDIEFNPARSINCQAYSAALYLSLIRMNLLDQALSSPEVFLEITREQYEFQKRNVNVQSTII